MYKHNKTFFKKVTRSRRERPNVSNSPDSTDSGLPHKVSNSLNFQSRETDARMPRLGFILCTVGVLDMQHNTNIFLRIF